MRAPCCVHHLPASRTPPATTPLRPPPAPRRRRRHAAMPCTAGATLVALPARPHGCWLRRQRRMHSSSTKLHRPPRTFRVAPLSSKHKGHKGGPGMSNSRGVGQLPSKGQAECAGAVRLDPAWRGSRRCCRAMRCSSSPLSSSPSAYMKPPRCDGSLPFFFLTTVLERWIRMADNGGRRGTRQRMAWMARPHSHWLDLRASHEKIQH